MTTIDLLGSPTARLVLYLPHSPQGAERFACAPTAQAVMAANSNHWRKIITLLAKVSSPVANDWRGFRDETLFADTALCFSPHLRSGPCWHWIAGQANLARFAGLEHQARALPEDGAIAVDAKQKLLLSPYPDYRQLSNARVERIRDALTQAGFYAERLA